MAGCAELELALQPRSEGEVVLAWSIVHLGSICSRLHLHRCFGHMKSHQDGFTFVSATNFNADIVSWNTSRVSDVFTFNADISKWDETVFCNGQFVAGGVWSAEPLTYESIASRLESGLLVKAVLYSDRRSSQWCIVMCLSVFPAKALTVAWR